MVIGRDTFLTPGDIKQMRHVPELVFINCCHLGNHRRRARAQFNRLAANLGVEFIRTGVRAVVRWLGGGRRGRADLRRGLLRPHAGRQRVRRRGAPRAETWERAPGVNTWGAYQCYGDPGFRLVREGTGWTAPRRRPFAPSELATELDNLTESIGMISRRRERDEAAIAQDLRERVDALLARDEGARRVDEACRRLRLRWLRLRRGQAVRGGFRVAGPRAALQPGRLPACRRTVRQLPGAARRGGLVGAARAGGDARARRRRWRAELAEQIEHAPTSSTSSTRAPPPTSGCCCWAGRVSAWPGCSRPGRASRRCSTWRSTTAKRRAQGRRRRLRLQQLAVACLPLRRLDPERAAGNWLPALAEMTERHVDLTRAPRGIARCGWPPARRPADRAPAAGGRRCQGRRRRFWAAPPPSSAGMPVFARGASPREVVSIQEHLDFSPS